MAETENVEDGGALTRSYFWIVVSSSRPLGIAGVIDASEGDDEVAAIRRIRRITLSYGLRHDVVLRDHWFLILYNSFMRRRLIIHFLRHPKGAAVVLASGAGP